MDIKVRMMTAQTSAVNEEKQGGGARLAAKQVREMHKVCLNHPEGSVFDLIVRFPKCFLGSVTDNLKVPTILCGEQVCLLRAISLSCCGTNVNTKTELTSHKFDCFIQITRVQNVCSVMLSSVMNVHTHICSSHTVSLSTSTI